MYTIKSLWTQARENLGVVTIVILQPDLPDPARQFDGIGAEPPDRRAMDTMLRSTAKTIDAVALAKVWALPACRDGGNRAQQGAHRGDSQAGTG